MVSKKHTKNYDNFSAPLSSLFFEYVNILQQHQCTQIEAEKTIDMFTSSVILVYVKLRQKLVAILKRAMR